MKTKTENESTMQCHRSINGEPFNIESWVCGDESIIVMIPYNCNGLQKHRVVFRGGGFDARVITDVVKLISELSANLYKNHQLSEIVEIVEIMLSTMVSQDYFSA